MFSVVNLDSVISENVGTATAVAPVRQEIHNLLIDADILQKQSVPYHQRILQRREVTIADFLAAVPEGYGGSSRGGREMASVRDAVVRCRERGTVALIVRW